MVNPINDALHVRKIIKKKYPIADYIYKRAVHLPSGLDLDKKDINHIASTLNSFFQNEC